MKFVLPAIALDTGSFGTIPQLHPIDKRINLNLHLQERQNSDDQLKIISQKRDAYKG